MLTMPDFTELPGPVYFRNGSLPPEQWESHVHPWGQFNYVARGVMEVTVADQRLVSPPQYAIWIPPGVAHSSTHSASLDYRSVYVAAELCSAMPSTACALSVSDLLRVLLEQFCLLNVALPCTPAQHRMAAVVLDQLVEMTPIDSYLPTTSQPNLRAAMLSAEASITEAKTLSDIAQEQHMSLRTFERLAVEHLGMSFGEWRQRLRFIRATEALLKGTSIDQVAAKLGYSNASSFGEMFKRRSGMTPDQFRQRQRRE